MIARIKAFAGVLKDSKHPFKMIVGQLLVKTGLNRFFTIPLNGYRINFSRSALCVTLFADAADRHEDEAFLIKILRPGDVYVDVGANIGTLALAACNLVGKEGKVIAIEAHPVTFGFLKANMELNGFSNMTLINAAVGKEPGSILFSDINSDDQNKVLVNQGKGITVELDTLNNLLSADLKIDLLKIDVEGYEKFVLEGAGATLQNTRIVFFESWEKHYSGFGYHTPDVTGIFGQYGFEVYKLLDNELVLLPPGYQSEQCENLLAIKDTPSFLAGYGFTIKQ